MEQIFGSQGSLKLEKPGKKEKRIQAETAARGYLAGGGMSNGKDLSGTKIRGEGWVPET